MCDMCAMYPERVRSHDRISVPERCHWCAIRFRWLERIMFTGLRIQTSYSTTANITFAVSIHIAFVVQM